MLATEAAWNPLARSSASAGATARNTVASYELPDDQTDFASFYDHKNGPNSKQPTVKNRFPALNKKMSHPPRYSKTSSHSSFAQHGSVPAQSTQTSSLPPANGIPQRNGHIMNMTAGNNSSLYQICVNLRRRLTDVPGFHEHIAEMEEEEAETNDSTDPVTSMWNCFRRGYPLVTVYNALNPPQRIEVDSVRHRESKVGKQATYQFLKACQYELKFPSQDLFLIADLYNEDTTGFVKVTKVVNRILDILDEKGLLMQRAQSAADIHGEKPEKLTHRQKIVEELVKTERDYVQHLELLQQFKNEIEQKGSIAGDTAHDIFLNLNQLLDFQRRFLIRIEQQNCLPEAQQNWGKLFFHYKDAFRVYEPFIANQNRCRESLELQWGKLRRESDNSQFRDLVETPATLLGFLLKPFQRLTRYPLLLGELREKGGLDEQRRNDLADGIAASRSILDRANDSMRKEERLLAVQELQNRVEDWKGHKIDHFGGLLLYGNYTVLKGEGAKEVEREYKVYLFERILLCCKEINPNKPKNKMLGGSKAVVDAKGKPKLQLKGRIFMQNVTDVLTLVKNDKSSYTVQIFWKGDPGVENFVIRFNEEKTMKEWQETVQKQKKFLLDSSRKSGQNGTSVTEFLSMKGQPRPENPYREIDIDEEDYDDLSSTVTGGNSNYTMSRNASNNSLRSFAGQHPGARMPHPRYPYQDQSSGNYPPLSLNTNVPPLVQSPAEFAGHSYFSPSNDSPISIRSNSQQSMYGFGRGQPVVSGWPHENNKHRTAPAIGRAPSREGPPPSTRPSLPAMATSQHPQQQLSLNQSRLRSASTPDIQGPGGRRHNGQLQSAMDNVPVPPIPSNMRAEVNRSQNNSPMMDEQLAYRSSGQQRASYDTQGQRLPQGLENMAPRSTQDDNRSSSSSIPYPQQLKVKIWFDPPPSHVTIVVAINIKYRTLIDRIDSKMVKVSSASIARGSARLRYRDQDGDLVTIRSDDDVVIAIEEWGNVHEQRLREGITDDFELFWQEKS